MQQHPRHAGLIPLFTLFCVGIFALLVLFAGGASATAAAVFDCTDANPCGVEAGLTQVATDLPGTGIFEEASIITVVLGWVQFALTILGTLAFVAVVWAGALYISSFANEENNESAKKILISAAIGVVVILTSYAGVATLISATA